MRILFVVAYAPSLIRCRPYQLIRTLARRGHALVVATLWTNEEEQAELESLAGENVSVVSRRMSAWHSLVNCIKALPTRRPLQSAFSWQPQLMNDLVRLVRDGQFDVVHVEHVRGAQYGVHLRRILDDRNGSVARELPIVWDSVDCISYLYRQASEQSRSYKGRLMGAVDCARTETFEAGAADVFDRILLTSPVDVKAFERAAQNQGAGPPRNLRILCQGVDLEYFSPSDVPRDPGCLVFSGKMSYHANIAALNHLLSEVMPHIWSLRPDVKLLIVGKNPSAGVRALCRRDGRVVVTGTVEDIRPYLSRATVAVAPICYGAGVQNKVLEAMACATPVVASPIATSALKVRPGIDVLVGDEPQAFARHVERLLGNPSLRRELGLSGRRYVEQHHSWDVVAARLESFYVEAAQTRLARVCVS